MRVDNPLCKTSSLLHDEVQRVPETSHFAPNSHGSHVIITSSRRQLRSVRGTNGGQFGSTARERRIQTGLVFMAMSYGLQHHATVAVVLRVSMGNTASIFISTLPMSVTGLHVKDEKVLIFKNC